MTDLERLIELLKPYMSAEPCEHESGSCELGSCRECRARDIVDHLIENGVILPPVKVGDTMWFITGIHNWIVKSAKIVEIFINKSNVTGLTVETDNGIYFTDIIGNFFFTREEAEAVLERRKKVNTT